MKHSPIPIPTIDGAAFFDNTAMSKIQSCSRLAQYGLIDKRVGYKNDPLIYGGNIHEALRVRYESPTFFDADELLEQSMLETLTKAFEENPTSLDGHRTLELATSCIKEYNKYYSVERFNVLRLSDGRPFVELPFAYKLCVVDGVTCYYTGKIDVGVEEDKQFFTIDHKTSSMMTDQTFENEAVSPQHEGYLWATKRAFGKPFDGFIINMLRTPDRRRKTAAYNKDDFQRHREYVDPARIDEWEENTITLIEEFFHYSKKGYFPARKNFACVHKYGKCEYFEVCNLPPASRATMLYSGNYSHNDWSPLDVVPEATPITKDLP